MFFENVGNETKELFYNNKILTVHELYIRNLLSLAMKACNNLNKNETLNMIDNKKLTGYSTRRIRNSH